MKSLSAPDRASAEHPSTSSLHVSGVVKHQKNSLNFVRVEPRGTDISAWDSFSVLIAAAIWLAGAAGRFTYALEAPGQI